MFGYTQLKDIVGRDVAMTQSMIDAINTWKNMLLGAAPWVDPDTGIVSLRLEQSICREFADVVLNEMECSVSHDRLNEIFQSCIRMLNRNMQDGLGMGSFVLKPLGAEKAEFITADKFVPISFDDNGTPNDILFLTVKRVGQTDIYTRTERHWLQDGTLTIENKAYYSTNSSHIGTQCPLETIPEWEAIEPGPVSFRGMDQMDFGYFRVPFVNRVDGSACGVSVFAEATDLIRQADIQYGRLDWEYGSAERAIHVDERALKRANGSVNMPVMRNRLYRGLNIDPGRDAELFKEYSPQIRDESFIRGLERAFRMIEFAVGLAYGDLSDVNQVERTASEVRASKQRKYNRVTAIQDSLRDCLEDFAAGLAFYNGLYTSGYEFSCRFSDSILTDEETEREQDRQDVSMGAMTLVEYRMKWYSETEEEAQAKIASAPAEDVMTE